MEEMTISEFKATCLKVIERIRRSGRTLVVTKNGVPAVLVSPAPPDLNAEEPLFGKLQSEGRIVGDIVSPLDDVQWDALK